MLKLTAALMTVLLAGCTTYYRNVNNPSFGQAEFDRDEYLCKRENMTVGGAYVPGVGGAIGATYDPRMVWQCMVLRGWRETSR